MPHDESMPALRVGICQVYTEEWAVEANFQRTVDAIREAGRQGADLVITPECVLHGYGFDDEGCLAERMTAAAEPADGPHVRAICALARELGMDVALGFAEKGEGGRFHNSTALISARGEILWIYRKVHCRSFEAAGQAGVFTPGDRFFVSPRPYGDRIFHIGAMICFDREVAESVRCLRSLGAELIACPLATNTFDMAHPANRADNEMITRCRAAENEVFIVVVNHAGRFNGGSFAVGPMGELLCQLGAGPEVRTLDIPVGVVARKFHCDPLGWMGWGYRRPEVYAPYLSS